MVITLIYKIYKFKSEDVEHFILDCNIYDTRRSVFLNEIKKLYVGFSKFNTQSKLCSILSFNLFHENYDKIKYLNLCINFINDLFCIRNNKVANI